MDLNVRRHGGYDLLSLSGEIDFHHSPTARENILSSLDAGRNVVVDLSAVSYIDSSGIASLVEGLQHARGRGLEFRLCGVAGAVLQVLQLTRLDHVFSIHPTAQEALDA